MATKKPAIPADEKFTNVELDLFDALAALDKKDYGYYGRLTEEQRKKFVPYMMLMWMSSVTSNSDTTGYYVRSTDFYANKYMFNENVQNHPELQWMMLCASSSGQGRQKHKWIPHLRDKLGKLQEQAKTKEVADYFAKIYPAASQEDIKAAADDWTKQQNHKHRLAQLYPTMKLEDIEVLASTVSSRDIDKYERDSGF